MNIKFECVPSLVQIETTYACNQKCVFCYNPQRDIKPNIEKLDKIVLSVSTSQIPHVYLIGGEPSLIPIEKLNEYIDILSINSSVAIITNGSIRLEELNNKVACIAIPIHGLTADEHDSFTSVKGSFYKTISNIRYYVSKGYDVRCVLVLTGYNYDKMYDMISFAAELGMESVYVDRYEDGGIGATVSGKMRLKPTLDEFRIALTQIIKARDDFKIFKGKVGFGTAIPMCIDDRLIKMNITSNCGVGTYFCAINPDGDLRLCNQSELKFGNVLDEPIEEIWNKNSLKAFRSFDWVTEPCKSCRLLSKCQCGCKVDANCIEANCSNGYCIDFAIRNDIDEVIKRNIAAINDGKYDSYTFGEKNVDIDYPNEFRIFKVNSYVKIHEKYSDKRLITRYRTISIDKTALEIITAIINYSVVNEKELIQMFQDYVEEKEIRKLVSILIQAEALELIGVV